MWWDSMKEELKMRSRRESKWGNLHSWWSERGKTIAITSPLCCMFADTFTQGKDQKVFVVDRRRSNSLAPFWMLLFKLTGVGGRMGIKNHTWVDFQCAAHQWCLFLVFFFCHVLIRVGNTGVCAEKGRWASGCTDASLCAEDPWYLSRWKRWHGNILFKVIWSIMVLS